MTTLLYYFLQSINLINNHLLERKKLIKHMSKNENTKKARYLTI